MCTWITTLHGKDWKPRIYNYHEWINDGRAGQRRYNELAVAAKILTNSLLVISLFMPGTTGVTVKKYCSDIMILYRSSNSLELECMEDGGYTETSETSTPYQWNNSWYSLCVLAIGPLFSGILPQVISCCWENNSISSVEIKNVEKWPTVFTLTLHFTLLLLVLTIHLHFFPHSCDFPNSSLHDIIIQVMIRNLNY